MAGFRFRLETMLKVRIADRDERRRQLADALEAERAVDEARRETRAELDLVAADDRRALQGAVNVDELLEHRRYALILQAKEADLQRKLELIRVETEKRRQALVAADREVGILEKLRERQKSRHVVQEQGKEAKRLDEVAVVGYTTRMKHDR